MIYFRENSNVNCTWTADVAKEGGYTVNELKEQIAGGNVFMYHYRGTLIDVQPETVGGAYATTH